MIDLLKLQAPEAERIAYSEGFTMAAELFARIAELEAERATHPDTAKQHARQLRAMLDSERPEDQTEARRLIDQGRKEARGR